MSIPEHTDAKISALVEDNVRLRREAEDADRRIAHALGMGRPLGAYLASPYSDPDASVRAQRYYYAVAGVAELYRMDPRAYHFSPIVHSYPIVQYIPALDALPWVELDLCVLRCCTRLVVLKIDGWDRSQGIARECVEATKAGLPIEDMRL